MSDSRQSDTAHVDEASEDAVDMRPETAPHPEAKPHDHSEGNTLPGPNDCEPSSAYYIDESGRTSQEPEGAHHPHGRPDDA